MPFNKPWISGKEFDYIRQAAKNGHLSGNGPFTQKCQTFFMERYGLQGCFLTTSCTDALEMAAMLINIKPGDEVIIPSFTFVSTALAFARQGAIIRFVDSGAGKPGIGEDIIEDLINENTRAIIPVHYAGVSCDMDKIMNLAEKYNIYVIEDTAHGIESLYKGKHLGSIGHFGCFSFHEAKNIHCGEGGMLAVNERHYIDRAEKIWEKGTNRAQFFRGEASYYEWKDTGSSFLPSEIIAAFLYSQLEDIDVIQKRRLNLWHQYNSGFKKFHCEKYIKLPVIPEYATINGNSFYLICRDRSVRDGLISHLKKYGVMLLSHYLPLHKSEYYSKKHDGRILARSEKYSETIVRFPIYFELKEEQVDDIVNKTHSFLCNY
ncbi:MAG: dTDP-4-amino-4,6-dideoxygalactose transaminase [Bacteroidales bacterium]|nr:dTDP-4-amino-4,6-dideoxygalactose transaminase [Bacteroidales bacterium]